MNKDISKTIYHAYFWFIKALEQPGEDFAHYLLYGLPATMKFRDITKHYVSNMPER